ncbi:MAG: hypothetical protein GF333_03595 [Candidatus Omnitrophica bacterium]|nr:hypothetical protein [Candidatus Omnitrophota bacterium]
MDSDSRQSRRVKTGLGRALDLGMQVPDFRAIDGRDHVCMLSGFGAKAAMIFSFSSLDDAVIQHDLSLLESLSRTYGDTLNFFAVSMDFSQRLRQMQKDDRAGGVHFLSDRRFASFGANYGVLTRERLLVKALFMSDAGGRIRKIHEFAAGEETIEDVHSSDELFALVQNPHQQSAEKEHAAHCVPCEAGTPPLPEQERDSLFSRLDRWDLAEGRKLKKTFQRKNFREVKFFFDLIAEVSEEQGHHPTVTLSWNKIKVTLTTHAAGGLTENDFLMAGILDRIFA